MPSGAKVLAVGHHARRDGAGRRRLDVLVDYLPVDALAVAFAVADIDVVVLVDVARGSRAVDRRVRHVVVVIVVRVRVQRRAGRGVLVDVRHRARVGVLVDVGYSPRVDVLVHVRVGGRVLVHVRVGGRAGRRVVVGISVVRRTVSGSVVDVRRRRALGEHQRSAGNYRTNGNESAPDHRYAPQGNGGVTTGGFA